MITTIILLLLSVCDTQKPFSIQYTQKYCYATAINSNGPTCHCMSSCCNYSATYPSVPLYTINPDCRFALYKSGYECMCPKPDQKVHCLNNKYQFFDKCPH